MATTMITTQPTSGNKAETISALQGAAWTAWNESYFAEDRDAYRTAGLSLYQQDVHERINSLFARLDEQNRFLDSLLQRAS